MARRGDIELPTAERIAHGGFDYGVETVTYDNDGRPYRSLTAKAIGTIERMAKRGAISDEMVEAAERFRTDFHISLLEPLRARGWRERVGAGVLQRELPFRAQRARDRALDAIQAVGKPGGSCLWAVVGEEKSLKEWGEVNGLQPEVASGVLIAALGALEVYYNGRR